MDDISCDVCMDLIPLVQDGVASEASKKAVEAHLTACPVCRAAFSGTMPPPEPDSTQLLRRIQHRLKITSVVLLCFGLFFGVSLTAGEGEFYNSLIMPIMGILGYCVFRWQALWNVPLLLFVSHTAVRLLGFARDIEHLDLFSILMWTTIYSILSVVGTAIAGLFHYAFRKEK